MAYEKARYKLPWDIVAVRAAREALDDDVFGKAAQLSYYFLLALFPLLLLLITILGFLAQTGSELADNLLSYAGRMLPYTAFELVRNTLHQIQMGAGGGKLSIGLLATLWAASSGMAALIDGLNKAYELHDGRSWWNTRALAIGITLLFSIFIVISLVLVLYGNRLGEGISGYFGYRREFLIIWQLVQWPLVIFFLFAAFGFLYRHAPAARTRRWREVLPGAVVGITAWLIVSLLFRLYLHYVKSYNATYGSLGAVIILMLWFYLSGIAILFGAEVNSVLEKARR